MLNFPHSQTVTHGSEYNWPFPITISISASEMTYIVSSGTLNSTHYHYFQLHNTMLPPGEYQCTQFSLCMLSMVEN